MLKLFTALRALLYASAFAYLWGYLALGVRRYDEEIGFSLPASSSQAGIALMVVGGLIALSCVATFVVRGDGTPAPFDAPRQLVVRGPYRYVRNPMYIGAAVVLVGFGLVHQSFSMALFALLFLLVAHVFVIFYEEPSLENSFGESYVDYKNRVHRWIPKIPAQ
ncbi:MAG: methyltransferase family protein [Bacteroidota bacterium]